MAKIVVSTDKLKELLKSTKIADRNKAVKIIQDNKIYEFGDDLFNLLNKEYKKGKSWQLIVACMNTLGDKIM
jgi:23S rRNA G2069 N7-methylase RlmK/C1962 C5-methylase RlmI